MAPNLLPQPGPPFVTPLASSTLRPLPATLSPQDVHAHASAVKDSVGCPTVLYVLSLGAAMGPAWPQERSPGGFWCVLC